MEATHIIILGELSDCEGRFMRAGNVTGVAIYASNIISQLCGTTKELIMDETYGANSARMGLFAVMAEYDGAGIPLAYLLLDVQKNRAGKRQDPVGSCSNSSATRRSWASVLFFFFFFFAVTRTTPS